MIYGETKSDLTEVQATKGFSPLYVHNVNRIAGHYALSKSSIAKTCLDTHFRQMPQYLNELMLSTLLALWDHSLGCSYLPHPVSINQSGYWLLAITAQSTVGPILESPVSSCTDSSSVSKYTMGSIIGSGSYSIRESNG